MKTTILVDDREVQRSLRTAQAQIGNLKPMMDAIGQAYEARVLEHFARQEDPEGNAWKPLSSLTLQLGIAGKKGGFRKSGSLGRAGIRFLQNKLILVQSGALRRSIHYQADADSMTIGVGAGLRGNYAAIHQFGGTIKPKAGKALRVPGVGARGSVTIPARPYLAANDGTTLRLAARDKEMVLSIIHQYLGDFVEGRT
jgi:phage gpG-like protein